MSIYIFLMLLAFAGADSRLGPDRRDSRSLLQGSSNSGFPSGVTLVPERPIGSPWLYSPNVSAVNAYICPGNSVVESLVIVNGSGNNNSPVYDGVPNWPSTIAAVQANCSGGIVLPGFFYNSSQDTCKSLGYGDSVAYTSKNYTGSNLSNFSQTFTYREGRLVYQINGQGSSNGTLGSASCPSQQVLVGYSGVQICEGISLLQFACAEAISSRGTFNSSKPFNLTTQISQQYVGRQLPDGVNVTSLGDTSQINSSLPDAPQGVPSGVTWVPQPAIGSPWLFSPNYTAASAYICQENTFVAYLTVLNGYGNNNYNSSQAVSPNSTIAYIQGTCSDGSVMPAFSYNFNSPLFQKYCSPLGYPSSYSYYWKNYNGLAMSTFAQRIYYRGDRIFSQLDGLGGNLGSLQSTSCPSGQKVVGYTGLETCDGTDLIQFACASLASSRGTYNSTQPIYMDTKVSEDHIQEALPNNVNLKSLIQTAASPSPAAASPSPQNAIITVASVPPFTSPPPSSRGLSGGAIAGIVVGVLAGLLAVAVVVVLSLRRRSLKQRASNEVELYTGSSYLSGLTSEQETGNARLVPRHSDLSHSDYSLIQCSELKTSAEAIDIDNLDVPQNNPSSFRSLPTKWQIPLSSLEIVCWRGEPVELGRGGFGLVYRAKVRKADAAVKVVKGGGEREQARLLHEIKVLEQCKSTHIVQFFGYAVAPHGLLLCMEFLPGGTLYAAIRDSDEFQWYNRGKQIIKDIASGLLTMHEGSICHLDIKSPNVLLTSDRRGKIADFGLGKMLNGVAANTLSQIGTPAWTCPALLLHGRYSVKSDIWSLSTIMIEVCTLERANRAMSTHSIMVPDQAPAELIPLIEACRADDPLDRPDISKICDWLETIY